MMNKALVVGINYYTQTSCLYGCVDDAHSVKPLLERHADGSVNFGVKLLTGTGPGDVVTRSELKSAIAELFKGDREIALFYCQFAPSCSHPICRYMLPEGTGSTTA
jgi:hypothetical protein